MERKKNIQTVQAIVGSSTVALTVTIILIIGFFLIFPVKDIGMTIKLEDGTVLDYQMLYRGQTGEVKVDTPCCVVLKHDHDTFIFNEKNTCCEKCTLPFKVKEDARSGEYEVVLIKTENG